MKPQNIYQSWYPPTVAESNNYNLRNRHNISQPANRLSSYQNSFFPSTIKTWWSKPCYYSSSFSLYFFQSIRVDSSTIIPHFRSICILDKRHRRENWESSNGLFDWLKQSVSANQECFKPIKKPVRTLSIFTSMAFVKDANGISFKNRLKGHINWRKVRNFIIIWMDESI
jgi:hypothetical protein